MRFAPIFVGLAIVAAPMALAKEHPKKAVDPNKKSCRPETMTGTLGTRSVCHTHAEWQAIDTANAAQSHGGLVGMQMPGRPEGRPQQ